MKLAPCCVKDHCVLRAPFELNGQQWSPRRIEWLVRRLHDMRDGRSVIVANGEHCDRPPEMDRRAAVEEQQQLHQPIRNMRLREVCEPRQQASHASKTRPRAPLERAWRHEPTLV